MTFQAFVKPIRSCTVRMTVTLTLNAAVGPNVSKIASTLVGLNAHSSDATLRTHRHATVFGCVISEK